MSHVFQIPDEQYTKLVTYAAQQHQTPETLFQAWVDEAIHNTKEPTSSSPTQGDDQERQKGREEETFNNPLFQLLGILSIDAPDLAAKHDEYLAESYMENHANNQ